MSTHNNTAPRILLIPGAWMGEWIWEPTVDQLRSQGLEAATLTLDGLEPGAVAHHVSSVRLEKHVTQVANVILEWPDRSVVLVSHSYSGIVVGHVADRLPDRVISSIHFDSFLPVNGRSLIDARGSDPAERAPDTPCSTPPAWSTPSPSRKRCS